MRRASRSVILSILLGAVAAMAGSADAQPQPAPSDPKAEKGKTAQRPLTSSEQNQQSLEGAVTSPLRDLNLIKTKIPPILVQAVDNPYARSGQRSCVTLRKEISDLSEVLGDDFDDRSPEREAEDGDEKAAYGVVASVVSDIIPMRSWIRKLSGAERRDRKVQEAIAAGIARRSYLKGVGQARGCKPPAAPRTIAGSLPAVKP